MNETDPRLPHLTGGTRSWWDWHERRFIEAATLYLPQGCPDWGERAGKRNDLCAFCALPNAVAAYREAFYEGVPIPPQDHIDLFRLSLSATMSASPDLHTLMVFNAGSFLADVANPIPVRTAIMEEINLYSAIRNVVIESRAELITEASLGPITEVLSKAGKRLTLRVGIETQDDVLRLKVLRKGHSRAQLRSARSVVEHLRNVRGFSIGLGGYALLNPAPKLEKPWALTEAMRTIDWILGKGEQDLAMDEVYFCSTNVGVGTPLESLWRSGEFAPADLWMVLAVLKRAVETYGPRVHLLPFSDEPEFLAVPSNHKQEGLPQNLEGASGCDRMFHAMFNQYRQSMDQMVLSAPQCECRPVWFRA